MDPERTVRLHVHIALAAVVLALFAPVLTWGLWLFDRRRAPAGPWKRRLLALAIVDTVLVVGLAAARVGGVDVESTHEPPRIGVATDPKGTPPGVLVDRVAPDSPAARASLRPGDRLVAVDGRRVADATDLARVIGATPPGGARRLTVVRDAQSFDTSVTPEVHAPLPSRPSAPLFAGEPETAPRPASHLMLGAGAIDFVLVGALIVAGRRRGAGAGAGVAVLAGLLALTITSSAVLMLFGVTMGISLGATLVAILAGSTALLVTDLVARSILRPAPLQVGPPLRTSRAISLGALYGVTGAARCALAVALLGAILRVPVRGAAGAFGLSIGWGPLGVLLFVLATVVVAPVAEELLFRGILLPWLGRWMSAPTALVWSAVVFGLGHLYYGLGALVIAFHGLVLGWARMRTGKIGASIALHTLLNGTTAAALLLESAR